MLQPGASQRRAVAGGAEEGAGVRVPAGGGQQAEQQAGQSPPGARRGDG